jgi:hypothetical protein
MLSSVGISNAHAMFASFQTKQVPIARLFSNVEQRLAQNTNDFELTYDLARLHAMAYSTNLVTLRVTTNNDRPQFNWPGSDSGVPDAVYLPQSIQARLEALQHLTSAIALYERAIVLLKKSTNAVQYKEWMVLPLELGHAWCLDQVGRRNEALVAYRKVLALAWKREVTARARPNPSFADWVEETWEAVKSGRNPLKVTSHGCLGPGVCFSEETIGYMLKLLDPKKDAKEIADLHHKQKTLNSMGRAVTPILVPVTAASWEELVDADARVTFDLDGSGCPRPWGWTTDKAAWLVYDAEGQGQITSALQMLGNVTFWIFWRDGYDALRSLDDDHDGVLRGTELRGLALWQDRNRNGVSEPGEVCPVSDWGIVAISCTGETHSRGMSWCPFGVTFADGETRPTYDWIAPGVSERLTDEQKETEKTERLAK